MHGAMQHYSSPSFLSASLDIKAKNVIIFGETGVGKSSVINLMAGSDVAETSSNLEGCTLQATEYSFTLSNPKMLLRVFDTVGLEESEIDVEPFIGALEKVQKLITSLRNAGGVDLILFCVKGGRFTAAMERDYHLVSEVLCNNRVPLALVITNLESVDVMENWWDRNQKTFEKYGIRAVAHACITSLPPHVTLYAEKRVQSRRALQKLLQDALNSPNPSFLQDIRDRLVTFMLSRLTSRTRRRHITKKVETYCALPPGEAQRLAELIMQG